ncbi:MAG TPA: tetratricopeptide repeat protein, partial [Pirellulales bacterium]|nr:tetratricopeptide repeat protein [Pirellulales bacterium]
RAELQVTDLTSTAVPGVGPHYQDVVDALAAFGKGDQATAFARLQNAKKVTPLLAPAEVMMAQLYFDAGQPRQGIAMLEKSIQTSPQDPEAYVVLMERAAAEGRMTEVGLMFPAAEKLALAFNQNPRRKQNVLGRLYTAGAVADQARHKLDGAKAKLAALIKIDPSNTGAHESLGRVLFAQNDQKGAYQEFQLAAEQKKDGPPAELLMAALFTDAVNAEKWLNFATSKHPQSLGAQVGAANYYLRINQPEQARQHAELALKLDPNNFEANFLAGLAARMLLDFPTAEKYLSKAHLLQPANADLMNHLSLVLIELPDETSHLRALQFADLVARQNPNNLPYVAALGWINYRLDRKAEADRLFKAVAKAGSGAMVETQDMRYMLANLQKDSGHTADAIKSLQSALNSAQPFGYRKLAEQMLAKLSGGKTEPGK